MQLSGGTFTMPRLLRTAPNGDIFVADLGAGAILILRGVGADGKVLMSRSLPPGLIIPSESPFIPQRTLSMSTLEMRLLSSGFHITWEICTRQAHLKPSFPTYRAMPSSREAVTGPATSFLLQDGKHMLVSVGFRIELSMILTHIPQSSIGPMCSNTRQKENSSRSMLPVFETASAKPLIPSRASYGARRTNATILETISFPDYVTSIKEGGFYGWPWYYIGNHQDPRLPSRALMALDPIHKRPP